MALQMNGKCPNLLATTLSSPSLIHITFLCREHMYYMYYMSPLYFKNVLQLLALSFSWHFNIRRGGDMAKAVKQIVQKGTKSKLARVSLKPIATSFTKKA